MENSQRTTYGRAETSLAATQSQTVPDVGVINESSPPKAVGRPHMAYLDGIRGLSALYVVLYHCANGRGGLPLAVRGLTTWMEFGRFAVDIFIVLSGYCLMLPVARAADKQLRGGVSRYLQRRARRIIPPYYAAIVLGIVLVWIGRHIKHGHSSLSVPDPLALSPGNLVAHLLLIHNLSGHYVMSLNPVMWTVALEWQLYFAFPLLLLPLWRRFGVTATLIAACLLGLAPLLVLPAKHNFAWTCPWFLGLFGMGLSAAVLSEARDGVHRVLFLRAPWIALTVGFSAALTFRFWPVDQMYWITDLLIGMAAVCLILHCGRRVQNPAKGPPDLFVRLFQSRAAVGLGTFSYSLYLIHVPIGWLFLPVTRILHLTDIWLFLFSLFVKIPLICALAYGFYLVFERPFTTAPVGRETKAVAT